MFASTMQAGSTTGVVNNGYALGLKSGTTCKSATVQEVSASCISAAGLGSSSETSGWNTSLVIPGQVRVDICLPVHEPTTIWDRADAFPWQPQLASEDIYIGIQELNHSQYGYSWGCSGCLGTSTSPAGLYVHCQANTTLAYFQLGNMSTRGVPSPFLDETPSSFVIPNGSATVQNHPSGAEPPAPLMAAAQAMFGVDSWLAMVGRFLDLVDSVAPANQTAYVPFVQLLCQTRPLSNAEDYFTGTFYDPCDDSQYGYGGDEPPAEFFGAHVRAFFSIFQQAEKGRAVLNTGTFFANSYLLSASRDGAYTGAPTSDSLANAIHRYDGLETLPVVPVVSAAALAAVSALAGLQGAGVLLLLGYAYSARVWTRTLDAFAMVRVGAQLTRLGADGPGALGVGAVGAASKRKLWARDGLIDTTVVAPGPGPHAPAARAEDGVELGLLPPPYSPRGLEPEQGAAGPSGVSEEATEAAREDVGRVETSSSRAAGLAEETRRGS